MVDFVKLAAARKAAGKPSSLMAGLEASLQPRSQVKDGPVTTKVSTTFPLNEDQAGAVGAMVRFIDKRQKDFFVLAGPAGTGKTFCIKDLINRLRGRMVFTAPTNKATKVLRESVASDDYKPECRTIYSLLGLRLEANGEIKELAAPEDPLDLSRFLAVVVDEASMINLNLMGYIREAAETQNIQFIFMGDPAQLPPVGEAASPIWLLDESACDRYQLSKVMRHDNQILTLVTRMRGLINHPCPSVKILSDNADGEGVWSLAQREWVNEMRLRARSGDFSKPNGTKAIAWRNVTVDKLNQIIRGEIFDDCSDPWLPGDRLTMLAPAKDHEGEDVAHTDDEGIVTRVTVASHPFYEEFLCHAVDVTFDDNHTGTVWLIHPESRAAFEREGTRLAAEARTNSKLWKKFWNFKDSFHSARHAYAITSHRAQGSTYETAFVDYRDILLNRNRREALQCLYVAFSRPKKQLFVA